MGRQPGLFDVSDRLRELSAKGDDLERISTLVDFEIFRNDLERAVPRSDGSKRRMRKRSATHHLSAQAKIPPSLRIDPNTRSCANPGHCTRMMKWFTPSVSRYRAISFKMGLRLPQGAVDLDLRGLVGGFLRTADVGT